MKHGQMFYKQCTSYKWQTDLVSIYINWTHTVIYLTIFNTKFEASVDTAFKNSWNKLVVTFLKLFKQVLNKYVYTRYPMFSSKHLPLVMYLTVSMINIGA